ncbi:MULTISPECIES: hypothetical protein [unclassified Streptomyces]|uniref:hypothetical protein n=1 Tax=unclassified Streptomyces TaxID=2593676 RepID=UPI0036C0A37A
MRIHLVVWWGKGMPALLWVWAWCQLWFLVVGLGYAVHRRPAFAVPVGVAVAAAGALGTIVVGVVQAVTS